MKVAVVFLVGCIIAMCQAMPAEEQEASVVRERRFVSRVNQPQPAKPQGPSGSVDASVHRERGVGTVVRAEGRGTVWTSKDGNVKAGVGGDWQRVYRGPAAGKPSYNVGASVSGTW